MEKHTQQELQESSKNTAQFNIAISKASKKQFMRYCLENELVVKEAAESALLEFLEKRKGGE